MRIIIECEYCGEEYHARRSSRKYCSDTCKTMAYRKRKEEYLNRIKRIDDSLAELGKMKDDALRKKEEIDAFQKRMERSKAEFDDKIQKFRADLKDSNEKTKVEDDILKQKRKERRARMQDLLK